MKRYLNSFLITLILYAGAVFTFITVFADKKIVVKKEKLSQQIISLKHIELIPESKKTKQIKKQETKKEEIKKEEIKKTIKKVEKKKARKVRKKKVVKKIKKVIKKRKVVKEKIAKKKEIKTKKITKQKETKKEFVKKTDVKKEYLSKNLSLIRKYIKQNVHYPKIAKRLNIEGIVKIRFTLYSNGRVDNIVILSGHNRLKKSTINAVKDASSSFPRVKKDITIELPIEYKLI